MTYSVCKGDIACTQSKASGSPRLIYALARLIIVNCEPEQFLLTEARGSSQSILTDCILARLVPQVTFSPYQALDKGFLRVFVADKSAFSTKIFVVIHY